MLRTSCIVGFLAAAAVACSTSQRNYATSSSGAGGAPTSSGTNSGGSTSSSTSSKGANAGGGASSSTGGDGTCVPSAQNPTVAESCGLFVSSSLGDDANPGTQALPLRSLNQAMQVGGGGAIYVCGESFAESVAVPSGTSIYGALDCGDGWKHKPATPTHIDGDADTAVLTFQTGTKSTDVHDVTAVAADATSSGGSSIAAIADNVAVDFLRVTLRAGNGRAGAVGKTPSGSPGPTNPNDSNIVGNGGGSGTCGGNPIAMGGNPKTNNLCPGGDGGRGGDSHRQGPGNFGDPGTPPDATNIGGQGAPPINQPPCTPGGSGQALPAAVGGPGGQGQGTLTAAGYQGIAGGTGAIGKPGDGGGGGGAAGDQNNCTPGAGGSGGAGGCGGQGGSGGFPGGSSIGLVAINATLTFQSTTIQAAVGGDGGAGGLGQAGSVGGNGGNGGGGNSTGCAGGAGAPGQSGGNGGGGSGGHSVAIAFTGSPPPTGATLKVGVAGSGGAGDATPAGDGGNGTSAPTLGF